MTAIPMFHDNVLREICNVLGDTAEGLTGSEIGQLLAQQDVEDRLQGATKRIRLYEALSQRQTRDRCGNRVAGFILSAMDPVRFASKPMGALDGLRERLNTALSFSGMAVGEDGKLRPVEPARTLSEARERANRLQTELRRRAVHHDVLRFCRAELLQDNFFHAVLEATKSVADKIRSKTGLTTDGGDLAQRAFGLTNQLPLLAFNSLATETEISEQKGLIHLLKGVFGTFRNVTAHAPRITWPISYEDALDLLTLLSFLHRRLDAAVPTSVSRPSA